jgi:dTMP kinase
MGKLIVIEGGDGAGKGTQTELAFSALKNFGEITMFDFPRYGHSVAANIVGQALRGDFGDFRNLDPHISSLPYMIDRAGAREDILAGLAKGNVICNRYTPSNVMYQSAKYDDPHQQDVPAYISKELVLIKDARAYLGTERRVVDQHEADQAYQHAIILRFLKTVEERDTWHSIECVPNYELLSVTPIHEMVMEKIKAIL